MNPTQTGAVEGASLPVSDHGATARISRWKKSILVASAGDLYVRAVPALLSDDPEIDPSRMISFVFNAPSLLDGAFAFTRGRPLREYPVVSDVVYKALDLADAAAALPERGYRSKTDLAAFRPSLWAADVVAGEIEGEIATADVVCLALPESCASYDAHAALRILQRIRTLNPSADVRLARVPGSKGVATIAATGIEELSSRLLYEASRSMVRRHFQFNYVANAQVVMGLTARRIADRELPSLSHPHQLQMLFHVRASGGVTEADLRERMGSWKGTGKYPHLVGAPHVGLGSRFSQNRILQSLLGDGLLKVRKTGQLDVSDLGGRVLAALHPDCEDADQVLRLERWAVLPVEVAVAKIDRYIRTFFGRQKRRLGV